MVSSRAMSCSLSGDNHKTSLRQVHLLEAARVLPHLFGWVPCKGPEATLLSNASFSPVCCHFFNLTKENAKIRGHAECCFILPRAVPKNFIPRQCTDRGVTFIGCGELCTVPADTLLLVSNLVDHRSICVILEEANGMSPQKFSPITVLPLFADDENQLASEVPSAVTKSARRRQKQRERKRMARMQQEDVTKIGRSKTRTECGVSVDPSVEIPRDYLYSLPVCAIQDVQRVPDVHHDLIVERVQALPCVAKCCPRQKSPVGDFPATVEGEVFFTEDANFMVEEFVEEVFFEGDVCFVVEEFVEEECIMQDACNFVEEFAEERGIKEERASVEEDTCTDVTTCCSEEMAEASLLDGLPVFHTFIHFVDELPVCRRTQSAPPARFLFSGR